MTREELLRRYSEGDRDFERSDLAMADLSSTNLHGINLSEAYLYKANLDGTNLKEANLFRANLRRASLCKTNLSWADLAKADLSGAILCGADLHETDLSDTDLRRTDLSETVLDPKNKIEVIPNEEFIEAGFEIDDEYVIGWRTKRSWCCGSTKYIVGVKYITPWFSTDKTTECHPGIYFAPLDWIRKIYLDTSLVKVKARKDQIIHAGDKWRAKEIIVIADE